jgi:endonuclease/exonuclease/phosphatase (EEP) superfamily protein YafD
MTAGLRRSSAARRWSSRGEASVARPLDLFDLFCLVLCTAVALLTACGPLGRIVWTADVVNLFRPYVFAGSLLVLLVCALSRRPALVALAAVLALVEGLLLAGPVLRGDALARTTRGERVVKVVTFNCLGSNPNVAEAVAWIRAAKPDILAVEELTPRWRFGLDRLSDIFPYRASLLETERSDTDVFSRAPVTAADAYRPASDLRALIHTTLQVDGRPVQVFGLHPNTLQTSGEWTNRNAALELTGQWIAQTRKGDAAIALGDWNTPPWSPFFHAFLSIAGLKAADPLVWPPMTRVLAAPWGVRLGSSIDHVAASAGVRVIRCETGPQLGSDHAPQICWLALPSRT